MRQAGPFIAALLFVAPAIHAAPVTWVYEAEVGFLNGSFDFDVSMGDRVTGRITFDADAALGLRTKTRTYLMDLGRQPGDFHPYMIEVSYVATTGNDDSDTLLEIEFTVATSAGPVVLSSGEQADSELRHSINEYMPLNDAPDAAFDSFRALSVNTKTKEGLSLRMMTSQAHSGVFPLEYLLATPPNLDYIYRGRVGYQYGGATMWAYIDKLELAEH